MRISVSIEFLYSSLACRCMHAQYVVKTLIACCNQLVGCSLATPWQ